MSKQKTPTESYLRDAKALARLFPSLAKYKRRKTLRPAEKSAIARARNVFEITQLPNDQRPEKYQHYTFPADRKRSDASYIKAARRMADVAPAMAKYKGRKQLTPSEKAAIAYKEKRLRHASALEPVTEKTAKKLERTAKRIAGKKARVIFPIPGIRAIKLRNIEEASGLYDEFDKSGKLIRKAFLKSRKVTATDYGMSVRVQYLSGVKRFYKFVYTGADREAMIAAADELFAEGARQVTVWLNHGRASESQPNTERFAAMIGDEDATAQIEKASPLLASRIKSGGYAMLLDAKEELRESEEAINELTSRAAKKKKRERIEELRVATENANWIYGVVGIFETRK